MTKKEFVAFLNQRLSVLNNSERKEIIDEYVQHIDLKVAEGKTEEQAIRDFGDLNEFVDDILEAYHVNPNRTENFIVDLVNKIANGISSLANSIVSMRSDKIISLIVEVLLLIIVLAILRWPFKLILEAFFSILFFLPHSIERFFFFIFDLCYAIVAIAVMYTFVKKRLYVEDEPRYTKTRYSEQRKKSNMNQQNYSQATTADIEEEEIIVDVDDNDVIIDIVEEPKKKETQVRPERRNQAKESSPNVFVTIASGFIKFILILVAIPLGFAAFGTLIGLGFLVSFLIRGIGSIGITLILLGIAVLFIALVSGIGSFVFGGKK